MLDQNKTQHIKIIPGTAGGQPHIAGRRIKVRDVAFQHEYLGRSADEIALEFDLSLAQVYAALTYYFDHRTEIEAASADRDAFIGTMRHSMPTLLSSRLTLSSCKSQ